MVNLQFLFYLTQQLWAGDLPLLLEMLSQVYFQDALNSPVWLPGLWSLYLILHAVTPPSLFLKGWNLPMVTLDPIS